MDTWAEGTRRHGQDGVRHTHTHKAAHLLLCTEHHACQQLPVPTDKCWSSHARGSRQAVVSKHVVVKTCQHMARLLCVSSSFALSTGATHCNTSPISNQGAKNTQHGTVVSAITAARLAASISALVLRGLMAFSSCSKLDAMTGLFALALSRVPLALPVRPCFPFLPPFLPYMAHIANQSPVAEAAYMSTS